MSNERYSNAYAEVLHYLKGISKKNRDKVPNKLIDFLERYKNINYICDFDYTKPLEEIKISQEAQRINRYAFLELLV